MLFCLPLGTATIEVRKKRLDGETGQIDVFEILDELIPIDTGIAIEARGVKSQGVDVAGACLVAFLAHVIHRSEVVHFHAHTVSRDGVGNLAGCLKIEFGFIRQHAAKESDVRRGRSITIRLHHVCHDLFDDAGTSLVVRQLIPVISKLIGNRSQLRRR